MREPGQLGLTWIPSGRRILRWIGELGWFLDYDWLNYVKLLNWDYLGWLLLTGTTGSLDLCSNFLSALCAQSVRASQPQTRVQRVRKCLKMWDNPKQVYIVRKIIINHQILGSDKPGEQMLELPKSASEAMESRESPEWSLQDSEVEDLRPPACSLLMQKREHGGGL
jgi:hypothetical protein